VEDAFLQVAVDSSYVEGELGIRNLVVQKRLG
jgi:hypothetical protein